MEQWTCPPQAERRCTMFNHRVLAVVKRELREKLLSKTFIFMTILFPALMFGMIGIQGIQGSYYNVVGLPIEKLYVCLKEEFGIIPHPPR